MEYGFDVSESLEQGVLRLFKQAVANHRWEVADSLMDALQRLAKSDPAFEAALEEAYLCIAGGR